MPVPGFGKFERFFRAAGGLDVDKNDVRRCEDFVNGKFYDLLLMAQGTARSNGRDIIQPRDLPITKGLQEAVHGVVKLAKETGPLPILDYLTSQHPTYIPPPSRASTATPAQHFHFHLGQLTLSPPFG